MDVRMPDGTIITGVPDNITQADLLARYNRFSTAAPAQQPPAAQALVQPEAGLPSIAPPKPQQFDPTKPLTAESYMAAVAKRKEETPDRSISDAALDTGITLLKGAIGLPESFVGLADIRRRNPSKGASMTLLEVLLYVGVFVVIVWWAWAANFDACDECNHDCNQGRDCPARGKK